MLVLKMSKVNGGRVAVYAPEFPRANNQGYVLRARYVMSQRLRRPLCAGEVIHHEDGDATNNSIGNLRLFRSESDHQKHHCARGDDCNLRKLNYRTIERLKAQGCGHKKISKLTGFNVNSVKSAVRVIRRG